MSAAGVTLSIDTSGLARLERRLRDAGARGEREFAQGMASVRRATGTEAKRAIVVVYNLSQRRVAEDLFIAAKGALGFAITGRRKPISFGSYGARASGRGVRVSVTRGKTTVIAPGFAAPAPGGNQLFWKRSGEAPRVMTQGAYRGREREPIQPLFGPSVADHLANDAVRARLERFFVSKLTAEIQRRLARLFRNGSV